MIAARTKPLAAYRHIIWDWNGTLLDDTGLCASLISGMLVERGKPACPRERLRELFDFPVIRFYERLGFDLHTESFEAISEVYIARYYAAVRSCGLQPGAVELLAALDARGVGQSILSAAHQDHLQDIVAHYGLDHYFAALNGIDTILGTGKTARARAWMERLGGAPGEVLLIGDTLHDYEVAAAIGVDCRLVACGAHPPERLAQTPAPVHADLRALGDRIDG
jgi:phosphoglycolate phosphatase